MIKKLFALFTAVAAALTMASCSGANEAEVLSALGELAPKAHELYLVIYTDELPHGEAEEDGYALVDLDAEYTSEEAILAAMEQVFTEGYIDILENTAFEGVSTDEGSIPSKFETDPKNGLLYVNPSATEGFGEPRLIDVSDAKVVKSNRYMAEVVIPHEDGDIEVTLRNVDGKWLIDSPLY